MTAISCPACGHEIRSYHPPLTKRQAEVLRYIDQFVLQNGYAPSFTEIAVEFGYRSLATVHEHITNLEDKGFIARSYNEARGITVLVRFDDVGAAVVV
jgi:SOS-response transcriptional repressor LexA